MVQHVWVEILVHIVSKLDTEIIFSSISVHFSIKKKMFWEINEMLPTYSNKVISDLIFLSSSMFLLQESIRSRNLPLVVRKTVQFLCSSGIWEPQLCEPVWADSYNPVHHFLPLSKLITGPSAGKNKQTWKTLRGCHSWAPYLL